MTDYTPPPIPNGVSSTPGTPKPSEILSILAVVIGAVAILMAIIPGLSFIAFLPGIAAVVLGILGIAMKKPGKVKSIVGLSLGAASFLVGLIVSIAFLGSLPGSTEISAPVASESVDTSDPSFIDESQTLPLEESNPSQDVTSGSGIPSGFEDGGAGVAYRFVDEGCAVYDYCVVVELFAYEDCPQGVDVEGNEIDYDSDTIYDQTFESTGAMYAGDNAVVELPIFNPRANGVQLTDIVCYY